MLSAVTLTHPGAVRPNNEDAILWDPVLGLLAIADGMGGHNAGEVASRVALDELQRALQSNTDKPQAEWPFGFVEDEPLAVNRLRTAARLANRGVFTKAKERAEYAGMGTTLTAALVDGARVWFASVGDSRLYVKPTGDSALRQLTRDDSFLGMLAATPGVQPLALVNHPLRHMLTSALGIAADVVVEVRELTLADGELLLMTTDGMHEAVGDVVMGAILDGHERGLDLLVAAEQLMDAALASGGGDNITLALARYTSS